MTLEPKFVSLAALGDFVTLSDEDSAVRARTFFETMKKRHTIRQFAPDPVPREIVQDCIAAAGRAPSGANQQPWHFALVGDPEIKRRLRAAAEAEERAFYASKASDEWLKALAPLGTDENKPYLEIAPWLICVFAQRRGGPEPGDNGKTYYMSESVGIACGFLIAALHHAGLATLTHTPNPMQFLNDICGRPNTEKPYMIVVVGKPAADARVPEHALNKKPLQAIMSEF
jgi:nitroreductase